MRLLSVNRAYKPPGRENGLPERRLFPEDFARRGGDRGESARRLRLACGRDIAA
jgi:hypothetical protein